MDGGCGEAHAGDAVPNALMRWECRRHPTPVLLGTYDARGRIHIKVRDRHWRIQGAIETRCPRCGAEHALDLRGARRAAVGAPRV